MREEEVVVAEEIKRVKVCRMETVCKMRYQGRPCAARARPEPGRAAALRGRDRRRCPKPSSTQVRQALDNLRDKQNVTVSFIGYTDDVPLTGRNERIYGDHLALSKARAHRVALAIQEALGLPTAAMQSDGRGDDAAGGHQRHRAGPRAEPPRRGRVLARRSAAGAAGRAAAVPGRRRRGDGDASLRPAVGPDRAAAARARPAGDPAGLRAHLRRAMADIAGRSNVRLRFIGYTRNERLDRRTATVYGDDIGLSAARARRAMDTIRQDAALSGAQAEHEGRGYVQSDDVVNAGFTQGEALRTSSCRSSTTSPRPRRLRRRRHQAHHARAEAQIPSRST